MMSYSGGITRLRTGARGREFRAPLQARSTANHPEPVQLDASRNAFRTAFIRD
jgi:hypothetical protein